MKSKILTQLGSLQNNQIDDVLFVEAKKNSEKNPVKALVLSRIMCTRPIASTGSCLVDIIQHIHNIYVENIHDLLL
jgi:hypothetical protein